MEEVHHANAADTFWELHLQDPVTKGEPYYFKCRAIADPELWSNAEISRAAGPHLIRRYCELHKEKYGVEFNPPQEIAS